MQLQSGQNILLSSSSITLNLRYPVRPGFNGEPDTCVFMLNAQGKVSGDNDFIFFNNLSSPEGAVKLTQGRSNQAYILNLTAFPGCSENRHNPRDRRKRYHYRLAESEFAGLPYHIV
jgi:stress response protein SCP2